MLPPCVSGLVGLVAVLASGVSAAAIGQTEPSYGVLTVTAGPTPEGGETVMPSQYSDYSVVPYHTGAALNDAALADAPPKGMRAWFNATYGAAQFEIGSRSAYSGRGFTMPFSLDYHSYDTYASVGPVAINVGEGRAGSYSYDHEGAGLVGTWGNFGGWFVCPWTHGVPQLLWAVYGRSAQKPNGCVAATLHYRCVDPTTGITSVPETDDSCYTGPVPVLK